MARLHGLNPERVMVVQQSEEAIAAGAFHNDVVAVTNERVLFAHEKAFADQSRVLEDIAAKFPELEVVEVSDADVPLKDAIASYLFNAQLVTPPDGQTTLIVPEECRETASVWNWIEQHIAGNGPIRRTKVVDVRQSMANGGGPACLRLRVVADPATVDPRFIVDEARLDRIASVIELRWPKQIHVSELQRPALIREIAVARASLLEALEIPELLSS